MKRKNILDVYIGQKLRDCRLKANLSQVDVVKLINSQKFNAKQLSKIEHGDTRCSYENLISLCNIYNITPDAVLYDFLEKNVKFYNDGILEKYNRLNAEDKNSIVHLIDYFLSK